VFRGHNICTAIRRILVFLTSFFSANPYEIAVKHGKFFAESWIAEAWELTLLKAIEK
jgi:hypothetical protein